MNRIAVNSCNMIWAASTRRDSLGLSFSSIFISFQPLLCYHIFSSILKSQQESFEKFSFAINRTKIAFWVMKRINDKAFEMVPKG